MEIQVLAAPFQWTGVGATPMQELCHDWHGQSLDPPARFALLEDPDHLWLIASRACPAKPNPTGKSGDFQAELWKHDVAQV